MNEEENKPFIILDGLMWEKETKKNMNWHQAIEYAKNLRNGGYNDWRLPTKEELKKIIRSCGGIPVLNGDRNYSSILDKNKANTQYQNSIKDKGFCSNSWYWSSTSISRHKNDAWRVLFYNGYIYSYDKDDSYSLRCVR